MLRPWLACALLLCSLAPAGFATNTGPDTTTDTTSSPHTFSWAAEDDFSGDLAYRITFDWGSFNTCELTFRMGGSDMGEPMRYSVQSSQAELGVVSRSDRDSQIVLGPIELVDEGSRGFFWGSQVTVTGDFHGQETWTFGGLQLLEFQGADQDGELVKFPPAAVDATCEEAFQVTETLGSHQVVGFTQDSIGGMVNVASKARASHTSLHASVQGAFSSEVVAVQYVAGAPQGGQTTMAVLDHPGGVEHWSHTSPQERLLYEGESGAYRLSFTRTSQGAAHNLAGVLVGLNPVTGLEQLA